MTDLLTILPAFPQARFAGLLPVLEQHGLSTTDLLALHPADIARQTRLPLLDLRRFLAAVQVTLSDHVVPRYPLGVKPAGARPEDEGPREAATNEAGAWQKPPGEADARVDQGEEQEADIHDAPPPPPPPPPPPHRISTLDPLLDAPLAGGVPTASVTELTGESGAGKTQLLLTLCLAVQLPPPHGLSRQALYLSTESSLSTTRLAQILASNPTLNNARVHRDPVFRPSLDNILSAATPDLESQDHILEYQVPVLLARHNIGLLVIDSVAANYRAEFERTASASAPASSYTSNMAARSAALVRLGAHLRDLARRHDIAIVVSNQVSDRFCSPAPAKPLASASASLPTQDGSPLATRSAPPPHPTSSSSSSPSSSAPIPTPTPFLSPPPDRDALRLDHQQRWFTGWGDDPRSGRALKTPSLGLVWSTQISCRIALLKKPVYGRPRRITAPVEAGEGVDVGPALKNWRRWIKVVFASHAAASGQDLAGATEFEVFAGGVRGVAPTQLGKRSHRRLA